MHRLLPALVLLLAACGSPPRAPRFSPVDSDGSQLRDQEGRTLLLRGVNVKAAGIFDASFDDMRAPREDVPAFDSADVSRVRQAGFNVIRLTINWSALEPQQGMYSTAYLDRIAAFVDLVRGRGIYVLLDLHEDGYSKEICEDGAPLWAIVPTPPKIAGGPVGGPDCHTAPAALDAFTSFFADRNGLQESYVKMLEQLATRFAGDDAVLGYEIMNEPIAPDAQVATFSYAAARAIRAVDARHLVLFEPAATRNFTNSTPPSAARFPVDGAVYAVHVYTAIFGNNPHLADGTYPPLLAGSIQAAREEANAWGTPLMITELGAPHDAIGAGWIGHFLDDANDAMASWTYWLWNDGLTTRAKDGSFKDQPLSLAALAEPFPQAVGGDVKALKWDGTQLRVDFTGRSDVPPRHDVYWNRGAPAVLCDGAPVDPFFVDDEAHVYQVDCGGAGDHVLLVRPAG